MKKVLLFCFVLVFAGCDQPRRSDTDLTERAAVQNEITRRLIVELESVRSELSRLSARIRVLEK